MKKRELKAEEEEIRYCIEKSKSWLEENFSVIFVNVLRRTMEKPPIWWQWLGVLLMGLFGGIGLGLILGIYLGPKQIQVIPIERFVGEAP